MEELELRQYWQIIRKRIRLVLGIPIIAVIVAAVVSLWVMTPQYQASTTLLVNQTVSQANMQYQDIQTSEALINTYTQLIKSNTIENTVISNLGLKMSSEQLSGMISVSSPDQSQVIELTVTSPNIHQAVTIANNLASVFQTKATQIMEVKNVQVVDKAAVPANPSPVKPNKKLNVAIALVLGLMVSIGLAFLLEYLDTRIKTEEDVRRYLALPVLGSIGDYEGEA